MCWVCKLLIEMEESESSHTIACSPVCLRKAKHIKAKARLGSLGRYKHTMQANPYIDGPRKKAKELIKLTPKLKRVIHAYSPNTQEAEASG